MDKVFPDWGLPIRISCGDFPPSLSALRNTCMYPLLSILNQSWEVLINLVKLPNMKVCEICVAILMIFIVDTQVDRLKQQR
jgi:hypothetical protein